MPPARTPLHSRLRSLVISLAVGLAAWSAASAALVAAERPNILIAISDDQSWPHTSAYGSKMVDTPSFDRIAREGVLFRNAFCASPGCSPSRAALLTGLHTWMLQHAGTHASYFPKEFVVFPDRLEAAGYFVGYTGKGWGPGDWKESGRPRNPAGTHFTGPRANRRSGYVAAFETFLAERPANTPFYFWFGSHDAHRGYEKGSGLAQGKTLEQGEVPPYLPDVPEVQSDLLDYAAEVDRFDRDLGAMLRLIEEAGELDNTLVIVTSDNGMPFPRAKANCYEDGIHVPLAVSWKKAIPAGRVVDDLVGFVDLTATIYEASEVSPPPDMPLVGRSLLPLLKSDAEGLVEPDRDAVFAARERHSSSRYNSLSYPQRCIRTQRYLYIRNFTPERWPAGDPRKFDEVRYSAAGEPVQFKIGPMHGAYHDIDACPTLDFLVAHHAERGLARYLALSVARRPTEELFDVQRDPACLTNLVDDPDHAAAKAELSQRLMEHLEQTGDPRVVEDGDIWETYPRVSPLRWFPEPEWAADDREAVPQQEWLEERRPK